MAYQEPGALLCRQLGEGCQWRPRNQPLASLGEGSGSSFTPAPKHHSSQGVTRGVFFFFLLDAWYHLLGLSILTKLGFLAAVPLARR